MIDHQIPKIIHYCWFGGKPHPELIQECISSWRKYCPDYEIIQWDETNFDISSNQFVAEAYAAGKWAFVSDYVRLYALFHYGGIYLDTDVELFKPLDCFLSNSAFTGFEAHDSPVTAIMGCAKGYTLFGEMLEYYQNRSFFKDGEMDLLPNTYIITDYLVKRGIILNGKQQTISGCTVYPEIVFCPNNILRLFNKYSRKTYCVHHFVGSWGANPVTAKRTFPQRMRMYLVHISRNFIGTERLYKLGQIIKHEKQ